VCDACHRHLAAPVPRCLACALPLTAHPVTCGGVGDPSALASVRAAVDYAFPWDVLVRRFKSVGGLSLAAPLADLMRANLMTDPACTPPCPGTTLVVPVPAAASRLAERGYHPAWELARRVARALCLDAAPQALVRRIDRAQTGARSADRFANMRAAFAAAPRARAMVSGRPVLLVDDVMTTGATLQAAARQLRQSGAARVDAFVLARTPAPTGTVDTATRPG
jgi:ComF family protein